MVWCYIAASGLDILQASKNNEFKCTNVIQILPKSTDKLKNCGEGCSKIGQVL